MTLNQMHFEPRVRMKLNKLRVRGIVVREGKGGAHREFTYRLLRPDVAAKAIARKAAASHALPKIDWNSARVLTA